MAIDEAVLTDIDICIAGAIRSGCTSAHAIQCWTTRFLDERNLCLPPKRPAFRTIDARLQSMRKRGAIYYVRGTGWTIPQETN